MSTNSAESFCFDCGKVYNIDCGHICPSPGAGKGRLALNLSNNLISEKYQVLLAEVEFNRNPPGGMRIAWSAKDIGFGILDFTISDGKLVINTEFMEPDFVKTVLNYIVDSAIIK